MNKREAVVTAVECPARVEDCPDDCADVCCSPERVAALRELLVARIGGAS